MWVIFAFLSALFAAGTSVLAKAGLNGVNSNLATAVRTAVVLVMSWAIVFSLKLESGIFKMSGRNWLFLILSGLATGASWLCYYKALQLGETAKVAAVDKASIAITLILAAIFLHEGITLKSALGATFVVAGAVIMVI